MGSSHSRPARSRPSTSTSASDGERPAVRRRLDPLRRLSTLGRRGIYGNGNKRDRPHSSAEDERDKRRRTSDSDDADEDDDLPEADGSRGRDSGAEEGEGGGDPLALERTRTIDTIRQALGDDWTPPSPTLTRSPSPPVVNARATPCFPTVPGPPVTTTLATPAPPPRSARPLFTPTPGVTRRWSTSYDPAPPLRGAEDGYIPLSRTQSELPPLAFLHPARGQSRMPGWYRARATDRLRAMSNERHTLSQRLQELRAEIDRQGIAGPQRPDGQGSGGADGAAAAEAPGAAIMIQGLAQMQHNPRPQPRGRWRRRGSVDAASAEQANAIASLLVVASAATATTLWGSAGPRNPPNQMLQTLMRRIRPRRPFSVRRNLGSYVYDSVPPNSTTGGNETAAEFVTWLEGVQMDIMRAMGEYTDGAIGPGTGGLSRRNSDDPPLPSAGEDAAERMLRRRSAPPTSTAATPEIQDMPFEPELDTEAGNPAGHDGVSPALQFFRAHIFPPADPNDTSPNAMVPCVFVGVRSITHDPSQSADDLMRHPSFPFTDGQVPGPAPSSDAGGTEADAESAPDTDTATATPFTVPRPQSRTSMLRSRLLALSPFTRQSPTPSNTQSEPTPTATVPESPVNMSTFLVFVVGGRYPRNHPILSIPALLTGAPLTDEEMVLIGELMGQVKPPTATAEEVEKSGLRILDAGEIKELVEKDEILSGSAERCLVCLGDYEQGEECRLLNCRHVFHKDCVDEWIKVGRNACPACRTEAVNKTKNDNETATTAAEGGVGPSVMTV